MLTISRGTRYRMMQAVRQHHGALTVLFSSHETLYAWAIQFEQIERVVVTVEHHKSKQKIDLEFKPY